MVDIVSLPEPVLALFQHPAPVLRSCGCLRMHVLCRVSAAEWSSRQPARRDVVHNNCVLLWWKKLCVENVLKMPVHELAEALS
jgi:hypothetical protein